MQWAIGVSGIYLGIGCIVAWVASNLDMVDITHAVKIVAAWPYYLIRWNR